MILVDTSVWIDHLRTGASAFAQLLAATRLTSDGVLWSRDRRLTEAADRLGVGFRPDGGSSP